MFVFGYIVFLPEPFGELSVCHRALPAVPAVGQKEQRRASCDSGVPEATRVLSRMLRWICLRGERGIAVAITDSVRVVVVAVALGLHRPSAGI